MSITDLLNNAPATEPERQYYFIAEAKKLIEKKEQELGRKLTCCVTTFGCQMNARDSEKLLGILKQIGYEETESENADFVVYNREGFYLQDAIAAAEGSHLYLRNGLYENSGALTLTEKFTITGESKQSTILSGITLNVNKETFIAIYPKVSNVLTITLLVTLVFIMYREDGRGLHDLMANTKVISTKKDKNAAVAPEVKEAEVIKEEKESVKKLREKIDSALSNSEKEVLELTSKYPLSKVM